MKVLDTNLLLYAAHNEATQHAKCRRWLETALSGDEPVVIDWIVISAFLRVSTNAKVYRKPLTVQQAIEQVDQWLSAPATIRVSVKPDHWAILARLIRAVGTSGSLTTDAHLAALAVSHDATLVSCDTDFARFAGLKWENPLAQP